MWSKHLLCDWNKTDRALREPSPRAQLVVCGHELGDGKPVQIAPIAIPPLTTRAAELQRIVDEYATESMAALGVREPLPPNDRAWIASYSAATLPEIEKAALRLVAIRKAGNVAGAAELLGMSHSSLLRWFARKDGK